MTSSSSEMSSQYFEKPWERERVRGGEGEGEGEGEGVVGLEGVSCHFQTMSE